MMNAMMNANKKTVDKKELPAMPEIRNYNSRAEWETACWRKISASKDLLDSFITSYERHNLIMRAAAVDAIASGKSYKQIGNELWLSPQTISGIKKALAENNYYRSYLNRSKKERKKRVYSHTAKSGQSRPRGTPRRTKYGTLYIP